MEGDDLEKKKPRLEADYSFEPASANSEEWKKYLLNKKNFQKDFSKGKETFTTPANVILEKLDSRESRRVAAESAVQVVLDNWDEIIGQDSFLQAMSPIQFVSMLAGDSEVDAVQKLWTDAPKDSELLIEGLSQVAEGLDVDIPLDQEGLEKLYLEHFDSFGFVALEIMLKRDEIERAKTLFEEQVDKYPKGSDPVMLDDFVRLGLPVLSAKKWLDQSVNSQEKYKAFYEEALVRWERYKATE